MMAKNQVKNESDTVSPHSPVKRSNLTYRKLRLLISGYTREKGLLQCFNQIIKCYIPIQFRFNKFYQYNALTKTDNLLNDKAYCVSDIGFEQGIHEIEVEIYFGKKDAAFRLGICEFQEEPSYYPEYHFLCINPYGKACNKTLYYIKFENFLQWGNDSTAVFYKEYSNGEKFHFPWHSSFRWNKNMVKIKFVVDKEKNTMKFYGNNELIKYQNNVCGFLGLIQFQ